jgi:hypothetical protein
VIPNVTEDIMGKLKYVLFILGILIFGMFFGAIGTGS